MSEHRSRPAARSTANGNTASRESAAAAKNHRAAHLGDFTVTPRVLLISAWALLVGGASAVTALALLRLIGLITNVVFYQRVATSLVAPGGAHHPWWLVLAAPAVGGLVVGLMARYGSEKIRGHGMPEAIEAILTGGSKVAPRVAVLKPVSAAVSIGTGGPFGAEGPIIMTGGAIGSILAQLLRLSADERKTLLVAGAAGGMAATFNSPMAAVLLAVELLLFEWRPRSFVPVVAAVSVATIVRGPLLGTAPLFGVSTAGLHLNAGVDALCLVSGVTGGLLAVGATALVYLAEDGFAKLPIHWMWWPAMGAVVVGIIGYFAPQTMGVGYTNISLLLTGSVPMNILFSLCVLKFISWAVSLGSGTSGGTLAPLFTIGGGLGMLMGILAMRFFPDLHINLATAALVGMAAMFAGASRALLTSIVFALETTGQWHGLLPLIGACTASYFVSFFLMKGSIMTEKMERHGLTPPETFEPDVLEQVLARNAMDTNVSVLSADNTVLEAREWIKQHAGEEEFTTFIVTDKEEKLLGLVQRLDIFSKQYDNNALIASLIKDRVAYIYPNNQLSLAIDIMDKYDVDVLPVVKRDETHKVIGVISRRGIFSVYHKRRNEDELYKQTISIKQRSMRMIVRGKQLFLRDKG